METIVEFGQKVKAGKKEIESLALNFDKVNGKTLLDAEKQARARGDQTPTVMFSMSYQTVIASRVSDLSYEELVNLPGSCFTKVLQAVSNFLFS